ncbi:response regulator transcription factor [Pseudomonadota bacterium]
MAKLLLIDDDSQLADLLFEYFKRFDFNLHSVVRPSEGLSKLAEESFDLVILDIMLPEMDGFEVCKQIRKTSNIPIIMLTARGDVMDRIVGIELGADDYLPKPFEPRELVVRIQSILKRSLQTSEVDSNLVFGELSIDTNLRTVTVSAQEVSLSSMEYQLLVLFVQAPGKVLSRDEILNGLKGLDADVYSRSVDILVSRLRHKLAPVDCIKTIHGRGYLFAGQKV